MIAELFRRRAAGAESVSPLQTARLQLVPITREMLEAEPDRATLQALLGAKVPMAWPPELWEPVVWAHIAAQLRVPPLAKPSPVGWHRYMVCTEGPARLVGCLGGFPCAHGDVELGYSVVATEQRQGYATEAVCALTDWLFKRPEVHSISAQAFESSPASIRVMQHGGMVCVGAGDHPGTVRYRRWRA